MNFRKNELKYQVLLSIFIISTWVNFPFITIFGAQLRFEFFTSLILLHFVILNRKYLGINSFHSRFPIALLFFILINLISSLYFALVPLQSLWMLLQIVNGMFAYGILKRVFHKELFFKSSSRVTQFIAFFYLIYCFLKLINVIKDPLNLFDESGRFHGYSFESNILASQSLFWIFIENKFNNHKSKIHFLLVSTLILLIFLSQTRAAIFCLLVYFFAHRFKTTLQNPIRIVQLTFLFALLLFLSNLNITQMSKYYDDNTFQGRILRLVDLNSGTALYRKEVIKIALDDFNKSSDVIQYLGSGTNSFKQHHEIDISKVESGYIPSLWIQCLYDSGLFGVFFILIFFMNQFRINASNSIYDKLFYVSVILCAGFTNAIWFSYFWLSLGFFCNPQINSSSYGDR